MRPLFLTTGPYAAASANSVALTQAVGAGALVTLNGALVVNGVAVLQPRGLQQKITITSAGNDSADGFVVIGTNLSGDVITETLLGGNATGVTSVLDYQTITSIRSTNATASTITVGTAQAGGSAWGRFDDWVPGPIAIQVDVYGTANYTVQTTNDDPNSSTHNVTPANMTWISGSTLVNGTTPAQGTMTSCTTFIRILQNSGSGSLSMKVIQAGAMPF